MYLQLLCTLGGLNKVVIASMREPRAMKIVKLSTFVLFMLAVVRISEAAEEKKSEEEKRFSEELSFSLVNTTGNSDALSLAGKNEMKYKFTDKWTGSWVAGALDNKSDGDKTAESFWKGAFSATNTNGRLRTKPNSLKGWNTFRASKTAAPGN